MNKTELKRGVAVMALVAFAGTAQASAVPLQGRDINGNAVAANDASAVFEYDANLNLTWLRNWNYAATTMDWDTAKSWASNLTVGTFSGWSLPSGDATCGQSYCASSPWGYLWFTELGNTVAEHTIATGPFQNVATYAYWTSTEFVVPTIAYDFVTDSSPVTGNQVAGLQSVAYKTTALYALAVRAGDLTPVVTSVPEPQSMSLMLIGIGALVWARRRRPV
jgi:hypothetical protein